MSKKATEFRRKAMSRMYHGKEILNTGRIDENAACEQEWVANIFSYRERYPQPVKSIMEGNA